MRADEGRPAPPLLAWAAAAALPVVGVLALMASPYYPQRLLGKEIANATRQAVQPARPAGARVVALGSSLLLLAMPASARATSDGWRWTQIAKLHPGLGHLEASLAVMEEAPPDVLVIEKNLFMPDREIPLMQALRTNVGAALKQATSTPNDADYDPPPAVLARQLQARRCLHLTKPSDAELQHHKGSLVSAYRHEPNGAFAARLRRLAERGVHVMILDVPRSSPMEQATAQEKQRWLARLHALLPPGPNVSYHSGPSYSDSTLYCDANHLNAAGATLFQQWWWPQLRQVQQGRG